MNFYRADGSPISAGDRRAVLRDLATEILRESRAKKATALSLLKERRKIGRLHEKLKGKQKHAAKLATLLPAPVRRRFQPDRRMAA